MNHYSEEQTKEAFRNLKENLPDQDVQNGLLFQIASGAEITQDYSRKSLKRINANHCRFNKSVFKAVAAVGSRFSDVRFYECDFSASNFQYCYFDNTVFARKSFASGANFSHSVFIECNFEEINIKESTFFDCQFQGCTFISGSINSITLENSTFYNCTIKKTNLAHLNLEYTQIAEILMEDVILPPYQVAYVIGGPSYLFTTKDKIFTYTDKGDVAVAEYIKLIDDLIIYYHSQYDFFPLANIMIGLSKYEEALTYIQRGIREAFDYFDFRMVKHYCKLAISCKSFSHIQLKSLYDIITELSYQKELGVKELHSYFINIGEIRELLLNTAGNKERAEFIIKTSIDKDDLESVNELYNRINHILKEHCSEEHIDSIELRHNSPYELMITCIDTVPHLMILIPAIYGLLMVGGKALDVYQRFGEVRRTHQMNALFKYEKKLKELEIMEKEQEMEAKKKISQLNLLGMASISEIEHNIICNTLQVANNIPTEYLHSKYTKDLFV